MMDLAELTWGRYNSGQQAPIGTFVNFRTMDYYQQGSDGTLPADGTYCLVSTDNTKTAAQIATIVNAVLSTSFTSGSFHSRQSSDAVQQPGQATNDA